MAKHIDRNKIATDGRSVTPLTPVRPQPSRPVDGNVNEERGHHPIPMTPLSPRVDPHPPKK